MGKRIRTAGIVALWAGMVLLLNSFVGVTGYAIGNPSFGDAMNLFQPGFLVGVLLLVVGFLMMSSRDESPLESKAGIKIQISERAEREMKKQDSRNLVKALEKIGTGSGREEKLSGQGNERSIRSSKGGRFVFHLNDKKDTAIIDGYTPNHNYDKALRSSK